MKEDFLQYMRSNGSKGGQKRAALGKEVLSHIAKQAWKTRRKNKRVAKVVLREH